MAPTPDLLACYEGVAAETLSALRDDLLPAAEAGRLRSHVEGCPACRTRLAGHDVLRRVLLAQPELEPGERIVAGVRERLAGRHPTHRQVLPRGVMRNTRRWSGLGALAAAAAVLLLFAYVLGTHPGRQLTSVKATPSATAALNPVTDVTTAWGLHAAVASFSGAIPGTPYYFSPTTMTPDGRYLVGSKSASPGVPAGAGAAALTMGLLDVATKRFTPISTGRLDNPLNCCQTDGRFVVLYDSDQPGATCGVCHLTYLAYDLSTGDLGFVAAGEPYQGIDQAMLSAGVLVLETGVGALMFNLETRGTRGFSHLAGIGPAGQTLLEAFAWPYLVYADRGSGSLAVVHIRDLRTGADVELRQLDSIAVDFSIQVALALDAGTDTLFVAVRSGGGVESGNGVATLTTLYELDHAMTSGVHLRAIAHYGGELGGLLSANSRLVLFGEAAWDRAEWRFVRLDYGATGHPLPLAGNYLALVAPTNLGGASQLTIYDTSRLPVRAGT